MVKQKILLYFSRLIASNQTSKGNISFQKHRKILKITTEFRPAETFIVELDS